MAKRFSGSTEKSEESLGDFVLPDKGNDFIFSGKELKDLTLVMEQQWPRLQNGFQFTTLPKVGIPSQVLAPTTWKLGENFVPYRRIDNFGLSSIKTKLIRFHMFLCTAIVTIAAYLTPRAKPKGNNRWKSTSVILVKKKQSSYQVSKKTVNVTSSNVLNAYAEFIQLCRITVLQTFERIKRESKNLLWKSKVFESHNYGSVVNVVQSLSNLLLKSDQLSDFIPMEQGFESILGAANTESDILSTSHRGLTSERANISSTQSNQSRRINLNANSGSERSTMEQIIADELAALAGEVGDIFDETLGNGDNYFDEMNANILREDSIDLPNLDDLEDADFDPIDHEGGDEYEEYESSLSPSSSYGSSPLPQRSPSPYNDHLRQFQVAHATYIANFDNLVMLSHNNFDASPATESDDDVDAPTDPKRPRLSDQESPKSPAN
jgi:hypothetical protein